MTNIKPDDVSFIKLSLFSLFFGMFGVHAFYVGRRIRGWIILGCMLAYIVTAIIWPASAPGTPQEGFRQVFDDAGIPFPLDFFGLVAVFFWAYDWFNIVIMQKFKYPVRILGKEKDKDAEKVL